MIFLYLNGSAPPTLPHFLPTLSFRAHTQDACIPNPFFAHCGCLVKLVVIGLGVLGGWQYVCM